jgi:hypothetical protein
MPRWIYPGSILVLLIFGLIKVVKNFLTIMDDIAEMVMDLTVALPKFESYTVIIPEAFELNEPLREMYESYVNCCIEAIFFLKKNRFSE